MSTTSRRGTPVGPTPAERQELARLLAIPAERDLPEGRREHLKEFLMHEIEQTSGTPQSATEPGAPLPDARRPRRWKPAAAGVLVAAVAAVAAVALSAGGGDTGHAQAPAASAPHRITTDDYVLAQQSGGRVRISFTKGPRLFDAEKFQADLRRMGVPALVLGRAQVCAVTRTGEPAPPPVEVPVHDAPESVFRVEENGAGIAYVVRPAGIPHGSELALITRLESDPPRVVLRAGLIRPVHQPWCAGTTTASPSATG